MENTRGVDYHAPGSRATCPAGPNAGSLAAAMSKLLRLGLVAALVCSVSCEKSGATKDPGKGAGSGKVAAGDIALRYKVGPAKLKQTGKFDMNTTGGGQFGEAAMEYTAMLELAAQGDKIKVVWSLADIAKLDVKGMFEDKGSTEDPKAFLVAEGKGAFLVDPLGKLDEKGTEGLAENAARRERFKKLEEEAKASGGQAQTSSGVKILALADSMVTLPDLPADGLAVGKSVTVEEEEEAQMGGIVMPSETETKYTLVKIDDSGGTRIAELQIDAVTSGATEVPGGMLSVDMTTEGSMLFDIDAGMPVSYKLTRSQSFAFGENTFESTIMLEASFSAI